MEAKETGWIVDSLAARAELERLQGNLDKAESLCTEGEQLAPESARQSYTIHSLVCHDRGRLDEALELMKRATRVGVMQSARGERRAQAIFKLWMAVYRGELGQIDQAWHDHREAAAELRHDHKWSLGECRWYRGEIREALDAFRRAATSGIESHHSRVAEQRVHERSSQSEPMKCAPTSAR
jgi:tetratricopeptide (TPR) repeat protein